MPTDDIREVYKLLGELRSDVMQRLEGIERDSRARFDKIQDGWDARFNVHQVQHEREKDYRSQLVRWAVTTVVAVGGVGVTLWLGIADKI